MKLTTLLLITAILQVSASTFAQKITLSEKSVPIQKVFDQIRVQTTYDFIFSDDVLKDIKPVSIQVKDADLKSVLNRIFEGQPLEYSIEDKSIVVSKKEPSLLDKIKTLIAAIDVKGRILDESGQPIPGATIQLKDGKQVTTTNSQGYFTIKGVDPKTNVIITVVGFEKRELPVAADMGEIRLNIATSKLDEVKINAGYYSTTDRERTGDISKVTAADIEKQPVNNPLLALEGRIPGVQITQQTGMSGGSVSVQIRGRSSINTQVGNDPLYIIDGVIYPSTRVAVSRVSTTFGLGSVSPLSMINPNDIESIEVLKDADATAIYGSRGANGVILVKTKSGNIGALKVNANFAQGFSKVGEHLHLLNTIQYLQIRREAFKNDGLTPSTTDYDVNGTWDPNKYTDWQKVIIGGTAHTTNAAVNLSGGTEKVNYLIGSNYYQEGTVFPGDFGFKRGGMHVALNIGSDKDKFKVNFSANYSYTQNNQMSSDLTPYILTAPNQPDPLDQNGDLNWANNTVRRNPFADALKTSQSGTNNLVTDIALSYRITDNLFLKTTIGYTTIQGTNFGTLPLIAASPASNPTSTSRTSNFSDNYNNTLMAEPQITYKSKLGPGTLDALAGMSFQSNNSQLRTITGAGFNSDAQMNNIAAAATLTTGQLSYIQYRYTAAFARLNYSLFDKYYLNVTARRDGSSRFGEGKQFANFGAVGGAWVFSDENLIKDNLPFLSFGKLRGSYGITGNDQIPDYGYLQLWSSVLSGTYQGSTTIAPTSGRIANPDFSWETNKKLEFAAQLGFFKDRIMLDVSWYRNISSNQLIGTPLPLSTGNTTITANRPATVQNTGLEFETTFKILNKQNWKWTSGVNLTIPKNKLLAYPGLASSSDALNYIIGQPLTIRQIYNVRGINPQTGLYDIEDKDGNGIINDNDRYLYKFTGQYYYGGFQNSVQYKQFSLDFLLSFVKQNSTANYNTSIVPPGYWDSFGPQTNLLTLDLSRWQNSGDQTSIPKASTISSSLSNYRLAASNGGLSIVDASYIRLKNIAISYSIPKTWLSRVKITDVKISLQGQNIFTLTHYPGLDPESQSLTYLPPLRTITLGLNVTL